MSNWITALKKDARELRDAYGELKDSYDQAVAALGSLAEGRGIVRGSDKTHVESMQRLASSKLQELAKRKTKAPYTFRF